MSETPSVPTPPANQDPAAPAAALPPTTPVTPVYAPAAPAPRGTNGFGIAALILGILAILGAAFPFVNVVSGILALAGLILGIIGLTRKGTGKGTAVAGTIISGVALIITIVASIIFFATINAVVDDEAPVVIEETEEPAVPEEPAADAVLGSFENPVPLGTGVTISLNDVETWLVTVEGSVLNANEVVAGADPSNPAPDAGFQYALLDMQFEHIADGEASPADDLNLLFATSPDDVFLESEVTAVTPAPSWRDIRDIQRASISGNVIVKIPTGSSGRWAVNPIGTDLVVYFATE
jgi:hypothetical protein